MADTYRPSHTHSRPSGNTHSGGASHHNPTTRQPRNSSHGATHGSPHSAGGRSSHTGFNRNDFQFSYSGYQKPRNSSKNVYVATAVLGVVFVFLTVSIALHAPYISAIDSVAAAPLYVMQNTMLTAFFGTITFLGEVKTVIILCVIVAIVLVLQRNWHKLVIFAGGMIVGEVICYVIKFIIARARPTGHNLIDLPTDPSFPSGHAFGTCLFFMLVAAMLYGYLQREGTSPFISALPYIIAGLLTLIVGTSRIYLGVHWPTDVLCGWLLGLVFALPVGRMLRLRS
ncbi:MAG: phosphatase PAP2 family protein [Coriobacteriales bacterium]|jgi:undecaprenyl-diphosphatase|nr:phosphatase PAP2 family protein [Coriobacteriales bacterium]